MSDGQPQESRKASRSRWRLAGLGLGIVLVGMVVFAVGATVWEYTNSPAFCGTTCHTMPPEYAAYQVSPHARVACVDCHLGQDSILTTIPRKAMEVRHVVGALTVNYETPIYVKSMRPARDTCEKCHFPAKFSADSLREVRHFSTDAENSETKTWLAMKTGGGTQREGLGKGIHWHTENEVWFIANDEQRQQIPYVKVVDTSGRSTEYFDVEANLPSDYGEQNAEHLRLMDCTDCHNRISHQFRSPEDILDDALSRQAINRNIPEIKKRGVEVLEAAYQNHGEAAQAIEGLADWYGANYPEYYQANKQEIRQAISTLQLNFRNSVFPDMDVAWETHSDNIGHEEFPGCFRCHDGKHVSADNNTIRLECNVCHSIPTVQTAGSVVPALPLEKSNEPASHRDTNWLARHRFQFDASCTACHTVTNPGGSDNSSFCSNSACHASEWRFAGLNAPKIRELSAPPQGPKTGSPQPIPHPSGPRTDCTICHGQGKVLAAPEDHTSLSIDMCESCHTPTLKEPAS